MNTNNSTNTKLLRMSNTRMKFIAQTCKDKKHILDVGINHIQNHYLKAFNKISDSKIIGLDLFCNDETEVKKYYDEFILGDLFKIDQLFHEKTFDAIILGQIIEHIKDPYDIISKCSLLLKEKGLLIISTPNIVGFPNIFLEILYSKKYFYTRNHAFLYSPRWLERILNNYGLKVVKTVGLDWLFGKRVPLFLSYSFLFVAIKENSVSDNSLIVG